MGVHSNKTDIKFKPLTIAVMTVSDSRTEETDTSGQFLVDKLTAAGHILAEKRIVIDSKYELRKAVSEWIADDKVEVVLSTGGTGLTGRDVTPEALLPLFDKEIEGFGELFRWVSYKNIKTSTIQSRAIGGIANGTVIFCVPGSNGACKDGWSIIEDQLDSRHQPCNMVEVMPRFMEK